MAVVVFEDKRRVVTALWLCPSLLSRLLVQSVAYQDGTRVLVRTEQRVGNGVGDVSFVRKRGSDVVRERVVVSGSVTRWRCGLVGIVRVR